MHSSIMHKHIQSQYGYFYFLSSNHPGKETIA